MDENETTEKRLQMGNVEFDLLRLSTYLLKNMGCYLDKSAHRSYMYITI